MTRSSLAFLTLISLLPAPCGFAAELTPTLKVGEQELVLNGSGTREKYFMEMYLAGLYLPEANREPRAIVEADAPMAIRIAISSKLVTQDKLIDSLQEGFENATNGNVESLRAEIDQFRQAFADEIVRGDVFDLVYVPTHGVMVFKNGKRTGVVPGLAFKQALFAIWLGAEPADKGLKSALLGGE